MLFFNWIKIFETCKGNPSEVVRVLKMLVEKNLPLNHYDKTYKYYNTDCPDWRWTYKYNYPPLLSDLLKHIPYFDTQFIKDNNNTAVEQKVQLCYVLPRHSLSLLPYKLYNVLQSKYIDYYPEQSEFEWSYCRYFWESHVKLPHINIEVLENVVKTM